MLSRMPDYVRSVGVYPYHIPSKSVCISTDCDEATSVSPYLLTLYTEN